MLLFMFTSCSHRVRFFCQFFFFLSFPSRSFVVDAENKQTVNINKNKILYILYIQYCTCTHQSLYYTYGISPTCRIEPTGVSYIMYSEYLLSPSTIEISLYIIHHTSYIRHTPYRISKVHVHTSCTS
jgi:hypothetical protein